jgi:hypothetical protein
MKHYSHYQKKLLVGELQEKCLLTVVMAPEKVRMPSESRRPCAW